MLIILSFFIIISLLFIICKCKESIKYVIFHNSKCSVTFQVSDESLYFIIISNSNIGINIKYNPNYVNKASNIYTCYCFYVIYKKFIYKCKLVLIFVDHLQKSIQYVQYNKALVSRISTKPSVNVNYQATLNQSLMQNEYKIPV